MKKIIKQDGKKRVFIYDDGKEISFEKAKEPKKETKAPIFKTKDSEKED